MRINVISIPVKDQEVALNFYTEKLGFIKKLDIPLSEGNRWLTLVAESQQDGPELLLEPAPIHFEPAKVYQKALFDAGIPYTQFDVDDVEKDYKRLVELGVQFSIEPTVMGTTKVTVFDDTCGNYIQLVEIM